MGQALRLDGSIIPRRVKRLFDQRREAREPGDGAVSLRWRGKAVPVTLLNISPSGAMLTCDAKVHIAERVSLERGDHSTVAATIRWVRDGRIGIHFDATVG